MRVLIEFAALFVTVALLVLRAQGGSAWRMLFHASGNAAACAVCEPGTRVFSVAPWFAGALAAIKRKRAGAESRRE
jgi:hypothetical protein